MTNVYGCTASESVIIYVFDWRCGNDNSKVKICHNGNSICVATEAVQSHLDHGDYLGPCSPSKQGENDEAISGEYTLSENFPNPFSKTTRIEYSLPESGQVQLKVYDIYSKVTATIINKLQDAGHYDIEFNGSDLPNGVYTYTLEVNGVTLSRSMVLVK